MTRAIVLAAVVFVLSAAAAAGQTLSQGLAAVSRHDYVAAGKIFGPLAEAGDPVAQQNLGYMYYTGQGVPQNSVEAFRWLNRAALQGNATGQYLLGLLYDKGQGVRQDFLEAYMWLDLAVARGTGRTRDDWTRIRNAIATKLTAKELDEAQQRALDYRALPEPRR